MALSPESLDPYLCTHIIYHQAKLDAANNKIVLENQNVDLKGKKNYEFLWIIKLIQIFELSAYGNQYH